MIFKGFGQFCGRGWTGQVFHVDWSRKNAKIWSGGRFFVLECRTDVFPYNPNILSKQNRHCHLKNDNLSLGGTVPSWMISKYRERPSLGCLQLPRPRVVRGGIAFRSPASNLVEHTPCTTREKIQFIFDCVGDLLIDF